MIVENLLSTPGNKNAIGNRGGRPTKYRPEYCDQARKLCMLRKGMSDADLAEYFEVDEATIYRWKSEYPEFCDSINKGKHLADQEVVDSLYNRARGYSHDEEKIFLGQDDEVIRVDTIKHYPPDTAAAFIWLKNRHPENWRDKQTIEIESPDEIIAKFLGVKKEELP